MELLRRAVFMGHMLGIFFVITIALMTFQVQPQEKYIFLVISALIAPYYFILFLINGIIFFKKKDITLRELYPFAEVAQDRKDYIDFNSIFPDSELTPKKMSILYYSKIVLNITIIVVYFVLFILSKNIYGIQEIIFFYSHSYVWLVISITLLGLTLLALTVPPGNANLSS